MFAHAHAVQLVADIMCDFQHFQFVLDVSSQDVFVEDDWFAVKSSFFRTRSSGVCVCMSVIIIR
jgi:hypothetical protein